MTDANKGRGLRRADINRHTAAELAIHNAIIEVEKLPANPMLTTAGDRLKTAKSLVADYVDQYPTFDISQPARIGIGAIVRLNSGGPNMLVTYPSQTERDGWICQYVSDGGLARDTYTEPMLTLLLPAPPEFIDRDKQREAEELGRRAGFYPESGMHDSVLAAPRAIDAKVRAHIDAKVRIGSAATAQSLLGIATTLKPGEEVLIPYDDIAHAFPQWKSPLPEIASSEQFRAALQRLPGQYALTFDKRDHWANDPANGQHLGDGQWRLTRLVATSDDMEELMRDFSGEGHGSRRLVQVIFAVLWHATEGKFPDLNKGMVINARD